MRASETISVLMGLALITRIRCEDISSSCLKRASQRICSTYYSDHLFDCIRGMSDDSFFRQGSEICLRPVPEYCVPGNLCDKLEPQPVKPQPVKPQASQNIFSI